MSKENKDLVRYQNTGEVALLVGAVVLIVVSVVLVVCALHNAHLSNLPRLHPG
jgi:ABC-type Co2+ transport system permease subunit